MDPVHPRLPAPLRSPPLPRARPLPRKSPILCEKIRFSGDKILSSSPRRHHLPVAHIPNHRAPRPSAPLNVSSGFARLKVGVLPAEPTTAAVFVLQLKLVRP
jgi:hypothetical protein